MQVSVCLTNTVLTSLDHAALTIQTHAAGQLLEIPASRLLTDGKNGKQLINLLPGKKVSQDNTSSSDAEAGSSVPTLRVAGKNHNLTIFGRLRVRMNEVQAVFGVCSDSSLTPGNALSL